MHPSRCPKRRQLLLRARQRSMTTDKADAAQSSYSKPPKSTGEFSTRPVPASWKFDEWRVGPRTHFVPTCEETVPSRELVILRSLRRRACFTRERFDTIKPMPRFPAGQTLLIDADDTLWENNVYFERAIAAFVSYLNHHMYSPAEVRNALNAVERETILARGYGLTSFTRSLVTCFERLSTEPVTDEKRERVVSFAHTIRDQEIELLPSVAETLADLGVRHRLIVMTKGDHAEQADKVA